MPAGFYGLCGSSVTVFHPMGVAYIVVSISPRHHFTPVVFIIIVQI